MGRGAAGDVSWLVKRSFTLAGHRTSIALEPAFWEALESIAAAQARSLVNLISAIDSDRSADHPLASMLRVHALRGER